MKLLTFGSQLVPDEALAIVFFLGALALLVGAKRIASALFLFGLASMFLPVLFGPMIDLVPTWAVLIGLIYLTFLIPFFLVSLLEALVVLALGRRAAAEMAGHLASRVAIWMLSIPFRLVRSLFSAAARIRRGS